MRKLPAGLLALAVLAIPCIASAQDPAVKELLDKAVKAQGGAEKAGKLIDLTLKMKAQVMEGNSTGEITMEMSIKEFDRFRGELTMTKDGRTEKATVVLQPDKGWARDANRDKVEEAPAEAFAMIQSLMLAIRAPGLTSALSARKDYTLAHGGESKVDDTPAEVLRLSRKDRNDITIYFDKKTSLPLKCETMLKEENGQEKNFVLMFSEFKDFGGAKHFTKIKISVDGKEMVDAELTDLQPGAKFEANTFEKP